MELHSRSASPFRSTPPSPRAAASTNVDVAPTHIHVPESSFEPAAAKPSAGDRLVEAGFDEALVRGHPTFAQAMVDSFLFKAFLRRGEPFPTTPAGEPALPVDGALVPWSELQERFTFTKEGVHARDGTRFSLLADGLTAHDPMTWGRDGGKLRPYRRLPPEQRPAQAELQIVMRPGDRHAWARLVDENGDVTAFGGAVVPEDLRNYGPLMNTVRGTVCCPDPFELQCKAVDVRSIPLTAEARAEVVAYVEDFAASEPSFNWINRNCNSFIAEVVQRACGEKPETLVSPQGWAMRHSVVGDVVPEPVRNGLDHLITFATMPLNPLMQGAAALFWGGAEANNPRGDRYLESPFQLLTPPRFTDPDVLRDWVRGGSERTTTEPDITHLS